MFEKLGVAAQVKPKIILAPSSGASTENVATGKVEFVITLFSEIVPVKGIEVLGPLPAEYATYVNFTAAASSTPRTWTQPRGSSRLCQDRRRLRCSKRRAWKFTRSITSNDSKSWPDLYQRVGQSCRVEPGRSVIVRLECRRSANWRPRRRTTRCWHQSRPSLPNAVNFGGAGAQSIRRAE